MKKIILSLFKNQDNMRVINYTEKNRKTENEKVKLFTGIHF